MTLYEIDEAILSCIDEETGEIIDEARLTALNLEREKKISNVACWYKNLKAEAEAIKAEKQILTKRQSACENKMEGLKKWLKFALGGEKYSDGKCAIGYRKSSSVEFAENFDISKLPDELKKITIEPRKDDIKKAIADGAKFEGCSVVENNNIMIK